MLKSIETIKVEGTAFVFGHYVPHENVYERLTEFSPHGIAYARCTGFYGGAEFDITRERWEALKKKANPINFSEAVWYDDSNDAFLIVMDQIGVLDGGVASMFLDGWVDGQGGSDEAKWWKQASLNERRECLTAYVKFERQMDERNRSH